MRSVAMVLVACAAMATAGSVVTQVDVAEVAAVAADMDFQTLPDNDKEFRNFENPGRDTVKDFYLKNHRFQTFAFASAKKAQYLPPHTKNMTVLEAMDWLDTLVDDSDPDTSNSQREHALQTAEAMRAKGLPDWAVLTGLLHDMGKMLCMFGEPQWAVVGDTFPLGTPFEEGIVYPEYFQDNPDTKIAEYQREHGMYAPGQGLDAFLMSWGHDEYMAGVMEQVGTFPEEAAYMVRYHSFYPYHREGAYRWMMNGKDERMMPWVQALNRADLYSKTPDMVQWEEVKDYYTGLIDKYMPGTIQW